MVERIIRYCAACQFLVIPVTFAMVGCASAPTRAGFGDVQALVKSRTGLRVHWNQGTPEDAAVADTIQAMLREPFTADAAVQIVLLNNPSLQATYEELGIAQADLVQAGLLKNPAIAFSARFPGLAERSDTETSFSVVQDFLDVFLRFSRKKLAAEQFKQAQLRVGDMVLGLAADVRSAYYNVQGAQQVLAMRQTVVQAAEVAAELAERQVAAGTVSTLDLAYQQALFRQAKLDLAQSEVEILAHRAALDRPMGLSGADADGQIVEKLPELPRAEPSSEELEALASTQRLDLAAARQETRVSDRAVSVARLGRVLPALEVGVETEREPHEPRVTGPTVRLEIPVFDRHQAATARARAQLRQSQQRLAAMEQETRLQVRLARDRLLAARKAAEYHRDIMIPLHDEIVASTQQRYNYMLLGVYSLVQAKQNEVMVRRNYIEGLRDYWIAWSELERVVGGRLAVAEATAQPPAHSAPPPQEAPHHRH